MSWRRGLIFGTAWRLRLYWKLYRYVFLIQLFAWGQNGNGQIGSGQTTNHSYPRKVNAGIGGKNVVSVACGQSSSIALLDNGEVRGRRIKITYFKMIQTFFNEVMIGWRFTAGATMPVVRLELEITPISYLPSKSQLYMVSWLKKSYAVMLTLWPLVTKVYCTHGARITSDSWELVIK